MIKRAKVEDLEAVVNLAGMLWGEHIVSELTDELSEIMRREDAQFFLKYEQDAPVGFAQCQLRHDYVEGTDASPVGYLEGIFIKEEYRHRGYGKELLAECEKWAEEKGCSEFASDCELENTSSFSFHMAVGFTEANRIICFVKKLTPFSNQGE